MDTELVRRLVSIRKEHRVSQMTLASRMGIRHDTLRHIEKGRRPLPDFMHGRIDWVRRYLKFVAATPEEEKEVLALTSHEFVDAFAAWMLDLENRRF